MAVIENQPATVQNKIVENQIDETTKKATQEAFEAVMRLESVTNIAEDLHELLAMELRNASFMTVNLELTDEQKEKLLKCLQQNITMAKDKYLAGIANDARTKDIARIVKERMSMVCEQVLSNIGQEVNRGAIISAVAVKADAKKEDVNSIELNCSKVAGDITIPCKGIFLATNCVKMIQDSCQVDVSKAPEKDVDDEGDVDPETGEVVESEKAKPKKKGK